MNRYPFFSIFFTTLFFIIISGCFPGSSQAGLTRQTTLTRRTMGTFYKIKYISGMKNAKAAWKEKVETRLKEINRRLSMYDKKSELSRFNRSQDRQFGPVSPDFFRMIETGARLYKMTDGAWDGTIKPLVDLWGFGTGREQGDRPAPETVSRILARTGFGRIHITDTRQITRDLAVSLDFGSIAKGYGVDEIARLFTSAGIKNVLVEIGGELYGAGRNKKDKAWAVGISRPDKTFAKQTLYKVVRLDNQAIATSGNYRNFYEKDGRTYSHIIDPATGYPVQNRIVSASVISDSCTFADGLATALMVMDVKDGIALVNSLEGTECLIVQRIDGKFMDHVSKGFGSLTVSAHP